MPILWGMTDGRSELAHRSSVTRTVQPVQHAVSARGGKQRTDIGRPWLTSLLDLIRSHGRHGAASPCRPSSGIHGEIPYEGGRAS